MHNQSTTSPSLSDVKPHLNTTGSKIAQIESPGLYNRSMCEAEATHNSHVSSCSDCVTGFCKEMTTIHLG